VSNDPIARLIPKTRELKGERSPPDREDEAHSKVNPENKGTESTNAADNLDESVYIARLIPKTRELKVPRRGSPAGTAPE